jgi:hypothetical protein
MKKIALALLTRDRYEYTVKTVESFLKHHNPDDFLLFHGDDASQDPRILPWLQSKGFKTVMQHPTAMGCSPSTDHLLHEVAKHVEPGTPVLYLQNDLQCTRPLPQKQLRLLLEKPDVSFVQLSYRTPGTSYSKRTPWKYADGELWKFGETAQEVVYAPFNTGMGFQPSISLIETWLPAVKGVTYEKQYRSRSEYPDRRMCRLTLPVFRHFGRRRTPGGMFGKGPKRRGSRTGSARYDVLMGERNSWQMSASLCRKLCELIKPGMKTLECGSGLSTYLFFALNSDHTALEDNQRYAPALHSVIVCPLVGDPPWYDWKPDGPYDLILVDGPSHIIGRRGLLRVIDELVHEDTMLIFDDTARREERRLCREVARRLNFKKVAIPSTEPGDFNKSATLLCK